MEVIMFDEKMQGKHLMLDIIVQSGENLTNPEKGQKFLEDIVETIGMTMVLPPITVKFPHAISEMKRTLTTLRNEGLGDSRAATELAIDLEKRKKEEYGYSSFVMIAESHLSMHTFPELGYFSFDCYSCKDFDSSLVISILHKNFSIRKMIRKETERVLPE